MLHRKLRLPKQKKKNLLSEPAFSFSNIQFFQCFIEKNFTKGANKCKKP